MKNVTENITEKKIRPRLGVNIDHIATLRQLRGTPYPDLLEAAQLSEKAGAKQITIHLREDRRHIQDADVYLLKKHCKVDLNLEMSMSPEIIKIAKKVRPEWVCIVPEKRQEVTTEGGLDVLRYSTRLKKMISEFHALKIKVSLFIEPDEKVVQCSADLGADAIEIHTGRYCIATQGIVAQGKVTQKKNASQATRELKRIEKAAKRGHALKLRVNAGHGLDYHNVSQVVALGLIEEYNIGHSIVCQAAMVGLKSAVKEMRKKITKGRKK